MAGRQPLARRAGRWPPHAALPAALQVRDGKVAALHPAGSAAQQTSATQVDLRGKMVLPTFADLHTHIGAGAGQGRGFA